MQVQSFTCPRCKRGEFRALPGLNGKAFCPWCGDAVEPGSPSPAAAPTPEFSLGDFAERSLGPIAAPPAAPASYDLESRLAESERRREAAEAELRRELEKRQEIKKVVVSEIGRLEAELADCQNRIRKRDEEHASALQTLNLLKNAREDEWNGDRMRLQDAVEQKEKALRALQTRLDEHQRSATESQGVLDASRAEVGRLHDEVAAADVDRAELRRKLGAAELKVQSHKDASAQLDSLKQRFQEALAKAAGLQMELEKKDKRIKELQLLVKTLGERLNDLADRPRGRSSPAP
jgi:chromosome segregation ATPase